MSIGHDAGGQDRGRDWDAEAFALAHPELARELHEAAVQGLAAEARHDPARERAAGTAFIAVVFVVLLAGREWFGWGGWSLVVLGATGLLLLSGAVEVLLLRTVPVRRDARRPGASGGGRR